MSPRDRRRRDTSGDARTRRARSVEDSGAPMGATGWSRREFLVAGAAGLTAIAWPWGRSSAAGTDAGATSVDDALLLDLTPTSHVPRQCSYPKTVFGRSRQRARQQLPL